MHPSAKKMDGKLLVYLILLLKRTFAIIYYSQTPEGYSEAVSSCTNLGGELLRYGHVFITGVRNCENNTRPVTIWTGHPHYSRLDCMKNFRVKMSTVIGNIQFADCADFCEDDTHSHIGISDTECACFHKEFSNECNRYDLVVKCPGNPYEHCGQNDKYILYEKDYNTTCGFRLYRQSFGEAGLLNEEACSFYSNRFFCKVGNGNEIKCNMDSAKTTVHDDFPLSIQGHVSSQVTKSSTVDLVTTREQNPQKGTQNMETKSCTLIWILAIAFVVISTSINVAVFIYQKKSTDAGKQTHNTVYSTPAARFDEHCYELPNMQYTMKTSETVLTKAYENINKPIILNHVNRERDKEYVEIK